MLINHANINENKLVIVENGINLDLFNKSISIDKEDIDKDISATDKLLIQVAGFRYQKDQTTTIKALQHLPSNVKLLLVGDGELRNELEDLVEELNLRDRVFFLGVRLDVPNLLKSSDISIISSHWEGMPLSVLEGMSVHIPVVASNVPGVSKLVENIGVLFERGNENQLADIINNLLADKPYYDKISKSCYEHSKRLINSTITIYENVGKSK